jgi:hypothetical protein
VIPPEELDMLMLSFCDKTYWRKVALIPSKVYLALEERGIEFTGATADAFHARMAALVSTGQLEAKGDIRKWRFSEIRLPTASKFTPEQA